MSLPLDKLLDNNKDRYNNCVAAIKISQRLASTTHSEDISNAKEKLAITSMKSLLNKEITLKEDDDSFED